jgi:predicted  nucleic acid-binding Zn-ribbon protein
MEEMNSLADLLDLQAVDLEIDRLLHERESLPELASYKETHGKLQAATERLEAARSQLRDTNLAIDKTNGELEIAEEKVSREQMRLYAGGLSARDADYMRREVEMLTRKKSEMEEEVLELLERADVQEAEVEATSAEVAELTETKNVLEAAITEAWKAIDARLVGKEERKANIFPLVDSELVELYEELRKAKGGVGVGRLADGVCGGCHLRITEAEELEVRRSDPPRCIHCRRILVV